MNRQIPGSANAFAVLKRGLGLCLMTEAYAHNNQHRHYVL
jgi:hypothetical protein